MKTLAQCVSWCALAGLACAAGLFFVDRLDLAATKQWMLLATVLWFATAPLWMEHKAGD